MKGAVVILSIALTGCTSQPWRTNRLEAAIDAILEPFSISGSPGASLLVRHRGEILVAKGYGLADLESGAAATVTTNYRLASVTKQFTAAAILLLVQEERVALEDPISRWLGDLPPWSERITIRQLLTHTSGVLDYEDLIPDGRTRQLVDADVLDLLRPQAATNFEPGSAYRYSNSGYALLALIVERASGESFPRFLERRLFAPLGMSGTVVFVDGSNRVEERAFGHSRENGGWTRTDQSLTSAVLGDGGVYASIRDLVKWDAELESPEVIDPHLLAQAFMPVTPTDVAGVSYGFGWRIGELDGRRTLFHTGSTIGFRNAILRIPEERLTVVLLTNRDEGQPIDAAREIARLVLGRPPAEIQ